MLNIQENLLTISKYSRPAIKIDKIKNIVVHYVGNPKSSAINNRNYFEGLKIGKTNSIGSYTFASSHYIIGLEGEIIRCVPENEIAYHGNTSNSYSIGIECTHPDSSGKFNEKTYESLITLLDDICKRYSLNPIQDIIRHYDVNKKMCPLYYVKNQDEWKKLKDDVVKFGIKSDVPQWQYDGLKSICDKYSFDYELWNSKASNPLTVGEFFGIMGRMIK